MTEQPRHKFALRLTGTGYKREKIANTAMDILDKIQPRVPVMTNPHGDELYFATTMATAKEINQSLKQTCPDKNESTNIQYGKAEVLTRQNRPISTLELV